MYQEDLLARLRTFAVRSRSATVEMSAFLRSLPTGTASPAEVDANVKDLAVKGSFAIIGPEFGSGKVS